MVSISTRLTEQYGLPRPFVQAGMAFAGETPELALAVSRAGGLGSIGVGFMPPDRLRTTIQGLRDVLGSEYPFNINFITCFPNDAQIQVCAEERVPIVSFHWGHPAKEHIDLLLSAGVRVWEQIGSVAAAQTAVDDGVSVVVAQGYEAGGHNYQGLGTVALVPAVVDAVGSEALVLAAGGIADARGVAAAMALGADGVWVGTRLVASTEAFVHPEHHRRLIEASGDSAVLTSIFGPEMPWFNPMRLLRNRVVDQWTDRLSEVPTDRDGLEVIGETVFLDSPWTKRKFDVILPTPATTGDFEEMAWLSGQGVGLIHDIKSAEDIVNEMMDGAADILASCAGRIVPEPER